ncbi:MAG: DNA repair protein RadA [Candidatus Ventricola sp.]|nr:DNA repair protein RadA [Clostridiales bacterium]MDY3831322.1 DNA repair protein RadA [Candidatus Ventricola sp.]MDY4541486.1 DNA repair protein RadA [Candidatus Ventricola sp.]MDY4856489.1 DNA repair protein RadA [Candidatus Ventricola sp.]
MAKEKTVYVCSACGYETPRWMGKCPGCNAWNTMEEQAPQASVSQAAPVKANKQRGGTGAKALRLDEIPEENAARASTGIGELDRVLGGGVVEGSLMLVGGDPGIGKSTLLLQVSEHLARQGARVLYISGEESARQIKMRARRLGVAADSLLILSENAMDAAEKRWEEIQPDYMIIDSIQTMYRPDMASAPGSVSQVRECASLLMRMAKTTGCAVFLVGHVTKEGAIAGPRILEHMVDVVLYFEGDRQHDHRILRAVKNRFGSVNELGLFEMHEKGMLPVANPSEMLLSERAKNVPGSCVIPAIEGSRPMLVDVQALALQTAYGTPRRTTNGFDAGRLALLLAVLEKRAGVSLFNQDVYVNVAGGLSLSEPAADLALCAAVASSVRDVCIPGDWAVMGEVGLAGEIRAVSQCERRLSECARLGFTSAVLPRENARHLKAPEGMRVYGVETLAEALSILIG